MGDPAEENDPPPESKGFLTNGAHSVNCKNQKKYSKTWKRLVLRQFFNEGHDGIFFNPGSTRNAHRGAQLQWTRLMSLWDNAGLLYLVLEESQCPYRSIGVATFSG